MTAPQQEALQRFIEQGKGWVGIHGAGLAGKTFIGSGKPYWQWFEDFLGGVTYSPHPGVPEGNSSSGRSYASRYSKPARLVRDDG